MMVQKFLSDFLNVLVWIACLAVGGVFVGVGVRRFGGLLMASLLETKRKCGVWVVSPLLAMALVCTVIAQKDGGANTNTPPDGVSGTNAVTQVEGGTNDWTRQIENVKLKMENGGLHGAILHSPLYTLHLVTQNPPPVEAFAIRPANAVENHWWRGRGAHVDGLTIPALGWSFRTPAGFLDSLLVYSYGEIQPDVETAYFPRPFPEADLSLLPEGRWGMLPHEGAESLFWHATSPSNSLILTWQNAAYNRDANCPTNLQIELFSNGTYVYRYDERTEHHAVEYPFDLDGDGLANEVDPDPLVAGPDAHGANAEWYDRVCSGVFSKTEQPNGLPIPLPGGESVFFKTGVNASAYYFVDVVAERGPAPIHFVADGMSRLGNPVVVAQAGETNHVPLLIGATYSVMSDVPLRVFAPVDSVLVEDWNSAGTGCTVKWPIAADFQRVPDNGILFGLDGNMHARLNGSCFWGGACCLVADGSSARYGCDGCGCGGCHAHVTYEYENYGIVFVENQGCGCGLESPLTFEAGTNEVETAYGANLSCYFDKRVVLFEEDYLDTPTNLVQGGSTTSCLFVVVHGGPFGGTLTLTPHNLEALADCDGGPVLREEEVAVLPGRTFSLVVPCMGQHASESLDDVRVEARFRENVSGCGLVKSTSTTVVEIDITRARPAPDNASDHRHAFGIGETMRVRQTPAMPPVSLSANDALLDQTDGVLSVKWGVADTEHDFSISARNVTYRPRVSVVRPAGIKGIDVYTFTTESTNHIAGAICLKQGYVVLPTSVCFENITVEEVPCYDVIEPTGYFTALPTGEINRLSHTRDAGAGKWYRVDEENRMGGSSMYDHAGVGSVLPHITPEGVVTDDIDAAWMSGRKEWRIPFGWQEGSVPEGSLVDPIAIFYETRQIFTISANGDYKVEKLGHSSERKFDGRIFTDGTPGFFPSQTNQQEE